MKKKLIYSVSIVLVLCVCVYILLKPKVIINKFDLPIANSYEELIADSDIVVKGKFTEFSHEWNMARDENNDPSPIYETIGRIYNFEIEKVYKGDVQSKSLIEVNQRYSETIYFTNDNQMFDTSEITSRTPKVIALDQLYIEPNFDNEYILFLDYEKNFNNYFGAFQPFMVSVNNTKLKLESNLINTKGIIEETYKKNSRSIIVRSEYGLVYNFSKDVSLGQFEDLF